MKLNLTIALFFSIICAVTGQGVKEKEVWARVEALSKAVFETKDSVTIKDLTSAKLTYGHSGGNIEDKATMVHNASNSKTVYNNANIEKLSLFFVNQTAVVRYIFRAISVENGTETPLNIGLLQMWAKENGKWKLFARQAVKVAAR